LLGAWLSAVFLIPKVSELGHKYKFFSNIWVISTTESGAFAGIISAIGYIGSPVRRFCWSQISFGNN
jgi:SSS family solute:Na+ symporter